MRGSELTHLRVVCSRIILSHDARPHCIHHGVWLIFCFGQPRLIGGHTVKLRQPDKGIMADVLEAVRLLRIRPRSIRRSFRHSCIVKAMLSPPCVLYKQEVITG